MVGGQIFFNFPPKIFRTFPKIVDQTVKHILFRATSTAQSPLIDLA